MESALYGIFTLVGFVSEISLVRCAHSFDFRYFTNSCENPVRTRFPWSNLYMPCLYFVLARFYVTIRLWARDFYGVTGDEAEDRKSFFSSICIGILVEFY